MVRIIFVDDEANLTQVRNYVDSIRNYQNRFFLGPTVNKFNYYPDPITKKSRKCLTPERVFFRADGAINYFKHMTADDYEWTAIRGMIFDTALPPGESLAKRFPFLTNKGSHLFKGSPSLAGAMLAFHLGELMLAHNRYGMKIKLLSNLSDAITIWKKGFISRRIIHKQISATEIFLSESGITIQSHKKSGKPQEIDSFTDEFYKWIK